MSPLAWARRTISWARPDVVGVGGADEPVRGDRAARPRPSGTGRPSRRRTRAAGRPSSTAAWAMLIECSSVPVRKRVSSPIIRCQRAMTSAPITSYRVCRPGPVVGVGDGGGQVEAGSVAHGRPMVPASDPFGVTRRPASARLYHLRVADPTPPAARARRIAYLSFSIAEFDARTLRMARTARAAGSRGRGLRALEAGAAGHRGPRWHPDRPRLLRLAVDRARAAGRRSATGQRRRWRRPRRAGRPRSPAARPARSPSLDRRALRGRRARSRCRGGARRRAARSPRWCANRAASIRLFPAQPLAWASSLEAVAEPADVWHGMWAGSLPALGRLRRRHGGRTIYDSRDVFLQSRGFATAPRPLRGVLAGLERRWARAADRVITVNDDYARLLADQLGIAPPPVVRNLPGALDPAHATARPDCARRSAPTRRRGSCCTRAGSSPAAASSRRWTRSSRSRTRCSCCSGSGRCASSSSPPPPQPPYRGQGRRCSTRCRPTTCCPGPRRPMSRSWPSSRARPTTHSRRPQKLFESLAAGVPVVAADLPGMARIVAAEGVGVLVRSDVALGHRRRDPDAARRAGRRIAPGSARMSSPWPTSATPGRPTRPGCSPSTTS